jgi:superfamily II DNA or RNA helicase
MEMVFLPADPPRSGSFALFDPSAEPPGDGADGAALVLPGAAGPSLRRVPVRQVPMADAISWLGQPASDGSASWTAWAAVVQAALGTVADGRVFPDATAGGLDCWRAGPLTEAEDEWLERCAEAFPPLAHCLPAGTAEPGAGPPRLAGPRRLIRACWDAVADAFVRTRGAPRIAGRAFADRRPHRVDELSAWLDRNRPDGGPRQVAASLRVVLPAAAGEPPLAVLQARSGSATIDASALRGAPAALRDRFAAAEVDLAIALHRGARRWPPLRRLTGWPHDDRLALTDDELEDLLGSAEESLLEAGIDVSWPDVLTNTSLTLRAVVGSGDASPTFSLESLLDFQIEVVLGESSLTSAELAALVESGRRLVRLRDGWVRADEITERLRGARGGRLRAGEALAAALTGVLEMGGDAVPARVEGPLARLRDRLARAARAGEVDEPPGFVGALRPYQRRGLGWLLAMCELGLGGCLADDMGLGKTIQVIALHVSRAGGPMLVACPASLLGNWEREVHAFAPGLPVRRYHGADRHLDDLAPQEVVLATYGVLRRDRGRLAEVPWDLVVADEAQHVKNPGSHGARELRAIPARARLALTGTPVENRLVDLWSILDWTTPGLLGPLERFRRRVAGPVERGDPEAAARFTPLVQPFVLRRRKTDPDVAPDLPARTEHDIVVPLTAEQATLYEAVVRETMAEITASAGGIQRRGLVLKLVTALKQVCNHPAHYLGQEGPLAGRSGKLDAVDELLDVIGGGGDSALVFTQYVVMGRLLQAHLAAGGFPSLFLHGGVAVAARDEMVRRFQAGEVPVFLLSVRAGGFGLNLTRATHVIHYDRWWNPAVEDQASDRAHRIGQDRPVQVHRLVTEGTVEDRIASLLARKRALAESVVGAGEAWIGELSDAELAALVALQEMG